MTVVHIVAFCAALFCSSFAYAAQEGRQAPVFSLRDVTGGTVTLEQFKGKVVFLDFWAPWCIPCRDELPELDRLYQKYRDSGFVVIGISVDTSADRVTTFMKKRPVGFPVVIDTQGAVAEAYRISGLPAGFLIDRDGVIMRTYRGSGKELISRSETDIADLLKRK
jgi:peroxiredoxin